MSKTHSRETVKTVIMGTIRQSDTKPIQIIGKPIKSSTGQIGVITDAWMQGSILCFEAEVKLCFDGECVALDCGC